MEHEAEAVGAASLGGLSSGRHFPVQSGAPCANCGQVVPDRFCTTCGQLASDFHRPFWELIAGSLGDMFALDGRLFRSVPMLMFRPGRMTRNYLNGQRARYVPPFRMFLLASIIFFLTVFTLGDELGWFDGWRFDPVPNGGFSLGAPESGKQAVLGDLDPHLEQADIDPPTREIIANSVVDGVEALPFGELVQADGKIDRVKLRAFVESRMEANVDPAEMETAYLAADRAATVYENQDRFGVRLREWAPRFSVLFLPVFSLLLTLLYAWHRRVYMFDHLIAGLHFQTFLYVLGTLLLLAAAVFPQGADWLIGGGFLAIIAYLYRMLRITYGSGRILSAFRTSILLIFGMILLGVLAIGLVILSFLLT
ncbi:DUF3667 domain-containing protein [Hyphomonas sp.]|uniref:DUF3667 domain-containing protein n=1 Tax=Hyphomonas sp. TaxID=87 RepID=UPI003D2C7EA5|tara:strand:+ start:8222 stop:9322 length:1101 start_codon:yes stop_codon:yes gene_type:complete